jgi:cell fate (sporulation/competence/biofilm development) regulator YlbF (YheA/YmcA/DUF963 family)
MSGKNNITEETNMNIFDKARALGEELLKTEEAKNRADAYYNYNNDEDAKQKMAFYKELEKDIHTKMENSELTKEEFENMTARLKKMGSELKQDAIAGEYIRCSNEFTSLVNQVFGIIQGTVAGDDKCDPSSCGGGCSGCN